MPKETKGAINWSLNQCVDMAGFNVCVREGEVIDETLLVYFVRVYFNDNAIYYDSFNILDLKKFM